MFECPSYDFPANAINDLHRLIRWIESHEFDDFSPVLIASTSYPLAQKFLRLTGGDGKNEITGSAFVAQ